MTAYETTPYGVRDTGKGWAVDQVWWGKEGRAIGGIFPTEQEARNHAIHLARLNGTLRTIRVGRAGTRKGEHS